VRVDREPHPEAVLTAEYRYSDTEDKHAGGCYNQAARSAPPTRTVSARSTAAKLEAAYRFPWFAAGTRAWAGPRSTAAPTRDASYSGVSALRQDTDRDHVVAAVAAHDRDRERLDQVHR